MTSQINIHDEQIKAFDATYRTPGGHDRWTRDRAVIEGSFLRFLPKTLRSGNVLDMGCGKGNVVVYAAQKGFRAYGFDSSPAAIEYARQNAAQLGVQAHTDFIVADALKPFPYKADFFDACVDTGLLHHILPEDTHIYLENLLRVLKKDGYYLLEAFSEHDQFREEKTGSSIIIHPEYLQQSEGFFYERFFSEGELNNIFEPSFNIISLKEEPGTTPKRVLWRGIMQKM